MLFAVLFLHADPVFAASEAFCEKGVMTDICTEEGLDPGTPQCLTRIAEVAIECQNLPGGALDSIKGFFDGIMSTDWNALNTALTSLLLFVGGMLTYTRTRLSRVYTWLIDPQIKERPLESHAVNVILVGDGGTGKTSIIQALSGSPDANPAAATAENALYSIAQETNVEAGESVRRRLIRTYISDHVGQNFGSIYETAFFKNHDLSVYPQCLVIVVDLFFPDKYGENLRYDAPDESRVEEQKNVYTDKQIQQLTALLKPGSKIILFINKVDKIKSDISKAIDTAKEVYDPLIQSLQRTKGAELSVVVGSARMGIGVTGHNDTKNGPIFPTIYHEIAGIAKSAT